MEKMDENQEKVIDSQVDVTKTKQFAIVGLLTWVLVLLAICSCLWRNDCNVLIGLLIVFFLNRQFSSNPAQYCKIIIHLLLALVIIDFIWMFIMFPYWNNSKNQELYSGTANALHTWVEFIGVLELLVKCGMIFIFVVFYKSYGRLTNLLNFNYS